MTTTFKKDQLVSLIEPENDVEHMLIFKIIDDSDQDHLLATATNSTLVMPPVEEFSHSQVEQWYPCMSDTDENGDINFDADIHNPHAPIVELPKPSMKKSDLKPGYSIFGNKGNVWNNACHISKDSDYSTLCGVPMLSNNWARIEDVQEIGIGCPECLAIYHKQ